MMNPAAVRSSPSSSHDRRDEITLTGSVLLVEDDTALAWTIERGMSSRGLVVHVASTGAEALRLASEIEPDLVLLDLGLPDIAGVEVCRHLRRWTSNPIIVVTVDDGENRKIDLLDAGADDYVTKPFSMPELMARVRVALRHRQVLAAVQDPARIEIGDLVVDERAHEVTVGGTPVELTRKEFALLSLLARNAGRVLAHATLLEDVWGNESIDRVEYLRNHIKQLRRKIGEAPQRPGIVNEPGVGYRLVLESSH
jgi:two-component system KDP operon response regulator KdpE